MSRTRVQPQHRKARGHLGVSAQSSEEGWVFPETEKDGTFLMFPVFQDHRAQVKLSTTAYKKPSVHLSPSAETRVVLFSAMFFPKVAGYVICLESSFC